MTPPGRRRLGSTYRLQLNGIGFRGALALVPLLDELGVDTCYVSPITRARRGSSHGYDVIDPTVLDPSLGTAADFEQLLVALDERGMGLLVDIVPNHMAASTESPFFSDVLRHGRESAYAAWFDIAWGEQDDKVLLPVLGGPLPEVIARGELTVVSDEETGEQFLGYFDNRYPLAPGSGEAVEGSIHGLLGRQHYRLADWHVANREVNYRRFFDINELIGVRQEDPAVFAATHALVLGLLADPRVRGVRIDHIDGMRDPVGYLESLRAATAALAAAPVIVVEKILEAEEALPDWPVDGTTGYEFGAAVTSVFIDPAGAAMFAAASAAATGDPRPFANRVVTAKREAITTLLPHQLDQIVELLAAGSDVDPDAMRAAVRELTAALSVYRIYRRPDQPPQRYELETVDLAAARAAEQLAPEARKALGTLTQLLRSDLAPDSPQWRAVAAWQQFSGPAAAKGVEDTALYDSGRLLAAADVGSDPDRPALSVPQFHMTMADRLARQPLGLSATSTHDSKRSHDVRCRLAVLSELPGAWDEAIAMVEARLRGGAPTSPDPVDRRYLYETVVGAWPVDREPDETFFGRIRDHAVKAAREAKRHTSWVSPDTDYEAALGDLVTGLGAGSALPVLADVARQIEHAGACNSLASVVLKAIAPGVPDIYQGDDSWFLALVDPDNRSPLDGQAHRRSMASGRGRSAASLLKSWRDGRVKQLVTSRALALRRQLPALFDAGDYVPLDIDGPAADHVVGFARADADATVIAVVPRLVHTLVGPQRFPVGRSCWDGTTIQLPPGISDPLTEAISGRDVAAIDGRIEVAAALAELPVAIVRTV